MPYEHRPNSGSLFKNRNKGDNEKAPNLKGTALLELPDGTTVELDIAAWTRESEHAGKWLSLSVKLKQQRPIRQHFNNDDGGRQDFNEFVNRHGTPVDDEDVPF
jgi:hypothetical protein